MASVTIKRRKSRVFNAPGRLFAQIIQQRKTRIFSLPFRVYNEEWDELNHLIIVPQGCAEKRALTLFQLQRTVQEELQLLEEVIATLQTKGPFTAADVVNEYRERVKSQLLSSFSAGCIWELSRAGQRKTASNYVKAVKRFLLFTGNRSIRIDEINAEVLTDFSAALRKDKLKQNTITSYLRILRALWNKAVQRGILPSRPSPFRQVYTGTEKTRKRALSEEVIQLLAGLSSGMPGTLKLARDLFLFSFYARGMAFVDVAHLKEDNLQGSYLVYERRKTRQKVRVKLLPEMLEIIERYRKNGTPYLFPAMKGKKDEFQEYESALRVQNKRLKKLAALIDKPELAISTHMARHSWASIANEKGVPIEIISQGLAHTSIEVTYIYISHIDNCEVDKANELIAACTKQPPTAKNPND